MIRMHLFKVIILPVCLAGVSVGFLFDPKTTERPASTRDWLKMSCSDPATARCPWNRNPLLLVSLDGFRAEYLLRGLTPAIEKLRNCGVYTPYMRAAYPTLTFPNHYTIITGLYPESHGIVGNSMYDPKRNKSFTISGQEKFSPQWWAGEPLWTTARKQGRKTASFFWVGSDTNISGVVRGILLCLQFKPQATLTYDGYLSGYQPDIWVPYDGKILNFTERVDTVFKWLELPEHDRPDFITLYFDEPDHTGHSYGPVNPQMDNMLQKMDNVIHYLMNGLTQRNLDNCVNLIVLADHGMTNTTCERQIALNTYLDKVEDFLIHSGTTGYIHTNYKSLSNVVYRNQHAVSAETVLQSLQCKSPHLNVFSKETIPVRHHYTNNDRIGNVIMDVEQSWLVNPKKYSSCLNGNHGYDNIYKSMHAMFLAHGPDLKQSFVTEPFENIELYNMMADLLQITPAPNNGTRGSLSHILRHPPMPNSGRQLHSHSSCSRSASNVAQVLAGCTCNVSVISSSRFPDDSTEDIFPFGIPASEKRDDVCLLHGSLFSSLYSNSSRTPVVSSFRLTAEQVRSYNPLLDVNGCVLSDPQLERNETFDCLHNKNENAELAYVPLFYPGMASTKANVWEAYMSTNLVPMFIGFRDGIWPYVWRIVAEHATQYSNLHVSVGPVYDYNADGLLDKDVGSDTKFTTDGTYMPIPTHYFIVLVKCSSEQTKMSDCRDNDLDTLSFLLPHQNHTNNCLTHKDFLLNNVARIRDIEHLTGLQFFSNLDEFASARIRTFLPTLLWESLITKPWKELPCPIVNATCPPGRMPLLLISVDGFRADYLERKLTPTIQRLADCGVHTPYMRSAYPTVTFPNHYTIVTGLYPESHGIVYNEMFDEEIGQIFTLSARNAKDPRWWKGEPLWISAQKQGLKTATYFWPGSDVNISGMYPNIWKLYDGKAGYTQRVYDVLDWITLPEDKRPDFITLYFDEPDHAGHDSGPDSEQVNGQLETVDELIEILMSNLYEKGLHNCINVIIVADHGMSKESCSKTINVADFFPNITNMLMFDRVFGRIFPQFHKDDTYHAHRLANAYSTDAIVKDLMCKTDKMKVFTKATLPIRHHYTNSARIGEVLLDMKDEWLVLSHRSSFCNGGNHGWDNVYKNMHALFLAHGPAFKDNFTAEPFENIELYNLMTDILHIKPAPNNGTRGSLSYILRDNTHSTREDSSGSKIQTCKIVDVVAVPSCGCSSSSVLSISNVTRNNGAFPFGIPTSTSQQSLCLLHQNEYTIGFSNAFNSPAFLSMTVNKHASYPSVKTDSMCIFNDPRVGMNDYNCSVKGSNDDVQLYPLLELGTQLTNGAFLSSSVVPLYTGFYDNVWRYVQDTIRNVSLDSTVGVIVGPAYDYNNDGLWEGVIKQTIFADENNTFPIPTHIYLIFLQCMNEGDSIPCQNEHYITSYILPNLKDIPNCLNVRQYISDNVARIRDVEILTGLEFLTSIDSDVAARMKTRLTEPDFDKMKR